MSIYKPHRVQKAFHNSKARFKLLCMGRQAGKTYSASQEFTKIVFSMKNGRSWILGPNDKLTDIAWNSFLKILQTMPSKVIKEHNKSKNIITLFNGHVILKKSAHDPDALVGDTLDGVLWCDEAALISEKCWHLVRPVLFVHKAKCIFTTTPRGKNWIYDIYLKCLDKEQTDYEFFHCTSYENPYIDDSEIDEAKSTLTQNKIREEIMAEFIGDNSAVFNDVRRIAVGTYEPYNPSSKYVIGVDFAKNHDFTVITCINAKTGNVAYWKRFTGMEWSEQVNYVVKIAQRYDADVLVDSTGIGEPVYDAIRKLHRKTEGLKFSNQSKQKIIENLIMKIEKCEITIPDIKRHKEAVDCQH